METTQNSGQDDNNNKGFKTFAFKRIIIGVLLAVLVIWISWSFLGFFAKSSDTITSKSDYTSKTTISHKTAYKKDIPIKKRVSKEELAKQVARSSDTTNEIDAHQMTSTETKAAEKEQAQIEEKVAEEILVPGVAFVEATTGPLYYELHKRFWGWRPNDILSFVTDNVNNFQLGVIKVTQRAAEKLADNISRTGSTAAFDKNLEHARSTCFVIEAESWMFPSAEGRYKKGLDELSKYAEKLTKGEATFYTRADNLIPLLEEFEHLLGDCDDNLVKSREENGSKVSFFKADNYFYYAKGVVSAMHPILEAIEKDFQKTLERRNCIEVIQRAIESCEHATHIHPWLVSDADLSSIFANHRANMAAHISHARFYVEVLIKTLST